MLQIREVEQSNIVGHREGITLRVCRHQRRPLLIEFDITVSLDDFRTVAGRKTARQHAVGTSSKRVREHRVGEGKLCARENRVAVLIRGAARLAEPIVGERLFAARNMRHKPFEHRPSGLIRVET